MVRLYFRSTTQTVVEGGPGGCETQKRWPVRSLQIIKGEVVRTGPVWECLLVFPVMSNTRSSVEIRFKS